MAKTQNASIVKWQKYIKFLTLLADYIKGGSYFLELSKKTFDECKTFFDSGPASIAHQKLQAYYTELITFLVNRESQYLQQESSDTNSQQPQQQTQKKSADNEEWGKGLSGNNFKGGWWNKSTKPSNDEQEKNKKTNK